MLFLIILYLLNAVLGGNIQSITTHLNLDSHQTSLLRQLKSLISTPITSINYEPHNDPHYKGLINILLKTSPSQLPIVFYRHPSIHVEVQSDATEIQIRNAFGSIDIITLQHSLDHLELKMTQQTSDGSVLQINKIYKDAYLQTSTKELTRVEGSISITETEYEYKMRPINLNRSNSQELLRALITKFASRVLPTEIPYLFKRKITIKEKNRESDGIQVIQSETKEYDENGYVVLIMSEYPVNEVEH